MRAASLAIFVLASHAPAGGKPISNSFESADHAWTVMADTGETNIPAWKSTGGNPGGFLMHHEWGGGYWWFIAPAEFHGDFSFALGGTLSVNIRKLEGLTPIDDPKDIVLAGGGLTLWFDIPLADHPTERWRTYTAPLDASGGWLNVAAQRAATNEEISQALSSLDTLHIRGDWMSGAPDRACIDNVTLLGPPCLADVNDDGAVNFDDINIVLGAFGATGSPQGDADADGDVDFGDLNIVLSAYATSC